MIRESERHTASGLLMLTIFLIILIVSALGIVRAVRAQDPFGIGAFVLVLVLDIIASTGFFTVAPNEGQVLQLFGAYAGTVKVPGLRWANPLYTKRRISLRIRSISKGWDYRPGRPKRISPGHSGPCDRQSVATRWTFRWANPRA